MAWTTAAAEPSSVMPEPPKWLEMPDELMENILQRLGTVEILTIAHNVCTTWRAICKDPAMWKVIDMHKLVDTRDIEYDQETLTKQAVDLSCGELTDICIGCFGTDDLLDYIVLRANNLKSLHLWCCKDISGSMLSRAVKMLPKLEELLLTSTCINAQDTATIGQNCPNLKSFMISKTYIVCDDADALAIANNMHELRHLELFCSEITNLGLQAILNGCPHLESLDVRWCQYLDLNGILGKLCMERIKDFKSNLTITRRLSVSSSYV